MSLNPCSIVLIIAVIVSGIGSWTVQDWRLSSKIADERRGRAEDRQQQTDAQTENDRQMTAYKALAASQLSATQVQQLNEKTQLQNELDRLNGCLRAGKCGLHVTAICPAAPTNVPASGDPTASGTAGASPRLDPSVEPDYFTLRRGLLEYRQRLEKCKQYAELNESATR